MEREKLIRFINSRYEELFTIKDGETVELVYPDGKTLAKPCTYIDEYHFKFGTTIYHICQFAEYMENSKVTYRAVKKQVLTEL